MKKQAIFTIPPAVLSGRPDKFSKCKSEVSSPAESQNLIKPPLLDLISLIKSNINVFFPDLFSLKPNIKMFSHSKEYEEEKSLSEVPLPAKQPFCDLLSLTTLEDNDNHNN